MRSEPKDATGRAARQRAINGRASNGAREPAPSTPSARSNGEAPDGGTPSVSPQPETLKGSLIAIVAVAGLAELAYAVVNVSAMPVYLRYSRHYDTFWVAFIGTSFLLCEGLAKGPFGLLGDKIGRKALIVGGPLISVFTSLLTLLVPGHPWYGKAAFVFLRALDGMGAAALWPSAMAMITDVVPDDHRSRALSLFNVTYLIGVAFGPLIGGLANDMTGIWTRHVVPFITKHGPMILKHTRTVHPIDPRTASFYLASALFLLTATVAWWRVPNVRPHHESHPSGEGESLSLGALWHTLKQMPAMMAMAFTTFLGIGMVMFIVKLFAIDELQMSEREFGGMLLLPALIIAAVSVPLGTIGDKIGRAKAVKLGIGLCAVSLWALIFIRNQWALVIGGTLIGVGFVIAFPAWMAYLSTLCDPRQRGSVMGAFGTAQGVGAMTGAPIGGWLYQHARIHTTLVPWLDGHYAPFIGCASMLFVAWLIAFTSMHERAISADENDCQGNAMPATNG